MSGASGDCKQLHAWISKKNKIRLITRSPLYRIFEPLRFIKRQIFSIIRPLGAMRTIELIQGGVLAEAPASSFLKMRITTLLIRKAKGTILFQMERQSVRRHCSKFIRSFRWTTELTIRLGSLETEAEQKNALFICDIMQIFCGWISE